MKEMFDRTIDVGVKAAELIGQMIYDLVSFLVTLVSCSYACSLIYVWKTLASRSEDQKTKPQRLHFTCTGEFLRNFEQMENVLDVSVKLPKMRPLHSGCKYFDILEVVESSGEIFILVVFGTCTYNEFHTSVISLLSSSSGIEVNHSEIKIKGNSGLT